MTAHASNPRFPSILAASALASAGLHALLFLGLSQVEGAPTPPRTAASRLDALAWSAPAPSVPIEPAPTPTPQPTQQPEPQPEPEPIPEPQPAPPPPEGRLGIADSEQDTTNWLGVADPTEHRAPLFDTEQPSWSPEPGIPLPPGNAANAGAPTPASAAQAVQAEQALKGDANSAPSDEAPTASQPEVSAQHAPVGNEAREETAAPSEGPMPLPAAAESTQGELDGDEASDAMDATRLAPSEASAADRVPDSDEPSLDVATLPAPEVAPTDNTPIGEEAATPHEGESDIAIEQDGLVATNEPIDDAEPVRFSSQEMAPLAEQAALLAPLPFTPPMAMRVSDAMREALRVATRQGATDAREEDAQETASRAMQAPAEPIAAGGQPGAPVPPGARPAEVSESDSSPTSRIPAIDVKLGRPAAGQGLEVITVRPRFSVTTTLTTDPQRSSIDVVFGRDGSVLKAAFLDGETTGYKEVDGPLLDAVYRWRAKGKALLDLPPGRDPSKGLVVTFHIEL
jgi:hypothetical protein